MGNILCRQKREVSRPPSPEYPPDSGNLNCVIDTRPTFTASSDLIIGIDFGTTYTGVAYAHAAGVGPITSKDEMRRAADKISVIKTWPNPSNSYAEKTPTVLAYNKNPPTWGGNVRPTDDPQIAYFKLGLQEDVTNYYKRDLSNEGNAESVLGGYLTDHNWRHPALPEMKAVDFAGDYLSHINQYITKEVFPMRYGEKFLNNQTLSYVITVPAIWSDKAKQLTRQAAHDARITENVTFITEPEAAALYCATLCDEVDLEPGDRFMICDAGGGTVDLIAYRVVSQQPFRVEECTVGTGAACGAMYLDRGFEALLRQKFESVGANVLDERRLKDLVVQFDRSIKRQFNPFDEFCETDFEISISGVQDVPEIGLRDGYLMISKNELQGVFETVFNQVLRLIKDQIDSVQDLYGENMRTLFLVGGLGSSLYLIKFLQSRLRRWVTVKQPEAGYSAIMRGAVLHKLGLDLVKDRVMRMSYGTSSRVRFREGYHPMSRRVIDYDGFPRCSGVMHWFAKKGVSLASGTVLQEAFYSDYMQDELKFRGPRPSVNELWISEDQYPPEYVDENVLKKHVTLTVNLKDLPPDAWVKRKGRAGDYYRVRYHLGLCFNAGGIEWRFLYKGNIIGSVECKYS